MSGKKWAMGLVFAMFFICAAGVSFAAEFTLTTESDLPDLTPGDGACITSNTFCSLRAAIQEANALPGPDVIHENQTTITLTLTGAGEDAAATGDLDITSDVTISSFNGGLPTIHGNDTDRVFDVRPGGKLRLIGLLIVHGKSEFGGAIRNMGVLVVDSCYVSFSTADGLIASSTTQGFGGGIGNLGGFVTITDSGVTDDVATGVVGGTGGGIYNFGGRVLLQGSTLIVNSATVGGAIANTGGHFEIVNTTIGSNLADVLGGGVAGIDSGSIEMNNVSISGNTAALNGVGDGGGIANSGNSKIFLSNTIVADNFDDGGSPECLGTLDSRGHNLILSTAGCTLNGNLSGNIIGQEPNMTGAGSNGGPTQTPSFAPFLDSPAIDAGDNATCAKTDQRGVPRPQGTNNTCDIGAVEVITAESIDTPFRVNSNADSVDANIGDGVCQTSVINECTLRAAIQEANVSTSGPKVILLREGLYTITIPGTGEQVAATGDLDLTDPDTFILGFGRGRTIVNGNDLDRVFHNFSTSTIASLTITNGTNNGTGGANIYNQGTLTLSHCDVTDGSLVSTVAIGGAGITNQAGTLNLIGTTVQGNNLVIPAANYGGAGIENFSFGIVNLIDSAVIGNTSTAYAGGVWNNSGTLNLTNTTISDNTSVFGGAGLVVRDTVNLNNSTIAFNHATDPAGNGGGIFNFDGTINVHNSIISSNTAAGSPECFGAVNLQGFNLVQEVNGCGLTGASSSDLLDVNSLLEPVQANGGATLTAHLPPTSPAFQTADSATCPAADQRGLRRPQGVVCDMGAEEFDQFLFVDTFEDGDASDWSGKGTWNVASGNLVGTAAKKADLFAPSPACSNCTIETNLRFDSATGSASIFGWYLDKKNLIEIAALKKKGKWLIKQRQNGPVVSKGKFIDQIDQGVTYHVKVVNDGSNITLFLNGAQALSIPSLAPSVGSVGLRVKGSSGVQGIVSFADMIVY